MPDTPPTPEEASAEARGVFPHASLRDAASLAIDLATFPLHMCFFWWRTYVSCKRERLIVSSL